MLAVVGAVALVVVAILVRSALVGDDADASSDGGDGSTPVVACSPSLAPLCDALAQAELIAADPPTLDLDDEVPADVDGWIAWDPGPAVAGYASDGQAPDAVWTSTYGLASAGLGVAGTAEALAAACGAESWACLAETLPGAVSVGDPATDEGLARIGPLARELADGDIDQIGAAIDDLVGGPTDGQRSAQGAAADLVTKPAAVDLVVGPYGLLDRVAQTESGRNRGIEVAIPRTDGVAAVPAVVLASRGDAVDARALCVKMNDVEAVQAAAEDLGLDRGCGAEAMSATEAGFLFQVKEKTT